MANKKTIKEMFTEIMANPTLTEEQVAFLKKRIELTERKNASGEKKQTATQIANANLKDNILDSMEVGVKYQVTDMIKQFPCCADLTNQKVSALVRQLVNDKLIVRTEDKRKAYFELA